MARALLVGMYVVAVALGLATHTGTDKGVPMDPASTNEYVECVVLVPHMDSPTAISAWNEWLNTMPSFTNIDYMNGMYLRDTVVIGYALTEDSEIANEKICLL
jgi:hypothetical protein